MWNPNMTESVARQNVVGGLDSSLGQMLDKMMGGNPNPTPGQMYGAMPRFGVRGSSSNRGLTFNYGGGYGYQYNRF